MNSVPQVRRPTLVRMRGEEHALVKETGKELAARTKEENRGQENPGAGEENDMLIDAKMKEEDGRRL